VMSQKMPISREVPVMMKLTSLLMHKSHAGPATDIPSPHSEQLPSVNCPSFSCSPSRPRWLRQRRQAWNDRPPVPICRLSLPIHRTPGHRRVASKQNKIPVREALAQGRAAAACRPE
jgi:hypothetical protein